MVLIAIDRFWLLERNSVDRSYFRLQFLQYWLYVVCKPTPELLIGGANLLNHPVSFVSRNGLQYPEPVDLQVVERRCIRPSFKSNLSRGVVWFVQISLDVCD
ncbi:hypothetical protein CCB81_05470 [Armatimonadetes bacterium Uphvl-Ar2]|nr:hypothetical protein CCB81_05470 [Armatimonadetes bacterium Uphvl-Ar2]